MEREIATRDLPFVSILVVNYNGKVHVDEFINSVFDLNYPKDKYEVVMVDNASSDGSVEYVQRRFPEVRVVRLNENCGFAEGNNLGASYCKGAFLALQNNDTVLDKNWLLELIRHAVKEPNALYGSKMLFYDRKDVIVYHGGRLLAWGFPFHLRMYERDDNKQTQPTLSFYADGCGALISTRLFQKLGGFEKSYFCYAEDYELSWKVWLSGHKVYFVPTSSFYHKVSSTLGRRSPFYIYLFWRNQLRNIIKFAERSTLVTMLPLSIIYNLFMYFVVYCLQERNLLLIFPILKAYLKVFSELPELFKVRREFQQKRRITEKELRKFGLILPFGKSMRESIDALKRKVEFWEEMKHRRWN